LQSGGIVLLDVKTLTSLPALESVIRAGLSRMAQYEKLSDELIAPNLDQDISFFTSPRRRNCGSVLKYPDAIQASANFFHELERTQPELVGQIQGERQGR